MLKLARNLFFLGFLIVLVMALLVLLLPHDMESYIAAAADKHRLLYSVQSPRIVLLGGSNTAFSLDSQKLAEHYGLPVVNMGLSVNLGLRYVLDEVKPALRDGDIVLIFPEYAHFSGLSLDGRPGELGGAIKFCPECISGITTPLQAYNVTVGIFETTESDILRVLGKHKNAPPVYTRRGFNAWGDMVAHLDQPLPDGFTSNIPRVKVSSPNPAIELMNKFYRSLDPGVKVFLVFPAIPVGQYKAQKESFVHLNELVHADLDIPVVGTPEDFIYPGRFFYDATYHLNREGRAAHTDHVIDMLEPSLGK